MVVLVLCGLFKSGKDRVAKILQTQHGFRHLKIGEDIPSVLDAVNLCLDTWTIPTVISGIQGEADLIHFQARPLFVLVAITAPLRHRYERAFRAGLVESFDKFMALDDEAMYGPAKMASVLSQAVLTITNDLEETCEHASLARAIQSLEFDNTGRWGRPSWDEYFMRMAELASLRSNCMKRRVGCILVHHRRVIATGYNGTARGMRNCSEGGCARCNRNDPCGVNLDDCICLHAEENALLEAGISRAQGGTIYCTRSPCFGCAKRIVQVGISRVVYGVQYSLEHNVEVIFGEAGVELVCWGIPNSVIFSHAAISVSQFNQ